jgi:hypothetical protein
MVALIARTLIVVLTFHVARFVVGPPPAQDIRLRHPQLLRHHGRRAALAQLQPWTQIPDLFPTSTTSNSSSTPLATPSLMSSSEASATTTAIATTSVPVTSEQLLYPIKDEDDDDDEDTLSPLFDASAYDYSILTNDMSKVRQPWTADPAFGPTVVVYGLAFALGFLGNLFVVIALLADRKWDSAAGSGGGGGGATNSFLVSLAVADVLFLVVSLPYEIGAKLSEAWQAGRALCKLATFVEMATAAASVLNLTAVSIERLAD